jgi:histidinol-phosphate aminotransferase
MLVDLKRDSKDIYERLLKAGVIIRPMGAWGLKSFIRVTIGSKKENERFIRELKRSLA